MSTRLSMIMPTRDRAEVLRETLRRIGSLDPTTLGAPAELIVVDNASAQRVELPAHLENGIETRLIRLSENLNTAARNIGAQQARSPWLLMLDDDSSPLDLGGLALTGSLGDEVVAVGAEIILPDGGREAGGLPEVIVGCGCLIRRDAFLSVGGYDAQFGYYAEEYDLCARLIARGWRITHSRSLRVLHRKSAIGRDFAEILYRLVRNNAWVMSRYAPEACLDDELKRLLARYRRIAEREDVREAYVRAMSELQTTMDAQPRSPLTIEQWDRFTGRAAARATLAARLLPSPRAVRIVGPADAKGRAIIEEELERLGVAETEDPDALAVVGSLSPGPMLDLADRHPGAVCPWSFGAGVG